MTSVTINKQEAQQAAKTNLNALAVLLLEDQFEFAFPPELEVIWQELITGEKTSVEKSLYKLMIGLPRGHAKTTLIKMFVVWCILFTKKSFFLVVSATQELADNVIADIYEFLTTNNMKAVFGEVITESKQDATSRKIFKYIDRDIIIQAKGAGSSLRGINRKNKRPDVIVMEDMQTRENAKSPTQSADLITWMQGTLTKARSFKDCLIVFIGNMYPDEGCILRKLRRATGWNSFVVGAILTDNEALWPELMSYDQLLAELADDIEVGTVDVFISEMLNDENANIILNFDPENIPPYPYEDELVNPPEGKFIIIDPATEKDTADTTVINLAYVYDSKPVCRKLVEGKFSPKETIEKAITLALEEGLELIVVESVAYQSTLLFWFNEVIEYMGILGVTLQPIHPAGRSKNGRILDVLKLLVPRRNPKRDAEILLHPEVRSAVVYEAMHFDKTTTKNKDDILDTIAYYPKVLENFRDFVQYSADGYVDREEYPVIEHNAPF